METLWSKTLITLMSICWASSLMFNHILQHTWEQRPASLVDHCRKQRFIRGLRSWNPRPASVCVTDALGAAQETNTQTDGAADRRISCPSPIHCYATHFHFWRGFSEKNLMSLTYGPNGGDSEYRDTLLCFVWFWLWMLN